MMISIVERRAYHNSSQRLLIENVCFLLYLPLGNDVSPWSKSKVSQLKIGSCLFVAALVHKCFLCTLALYLGKYLFFKLCSISPFGLRYFTSHARIL